MEDSSMPKRTIAITIGLIAVVALLGYGSTALAHRGGRPGYGYGPGACWSDLNDQQVEQLKSQRKAFFDATQDLRQQIYEKQAQLRDELAKPTPDQGKAAQLQKELSELNGQFDQKRLEYMIEAKKIDPELGNRYEGRGYHRRGYGPMGGHGDGPMGGRGFGPMGDRPCWE
jgi:zinc resistance-associated protein